MAKRKPTTGAGLDKVSDYRHEGKKRKNIPPAKLAAEGTVPILAKIEYSYSPRRSPVLRFDSSGDADKLPELLAAAKNRKLTDDEVRLLAEALRTQEPWLEWAGKREMPGFAVDPVALHIHERVSAQAILKIAARQDVERTLFGDPEQEYREAVQFYRHDINWTNRLILGDSLHAMASLAKREDLAGKVQMIYIDPPYGIKYPSNFQPEIGKRDVKDKEQDLTREPEMVQAYRDTWHIGVHSYLTYLRDRLITARELLADAGSIFVQISDENLHRVRLILDEVFGAENSVSIITFAKTSGSTQEYLASTADHLIWYAKHRDQMKYRPIFRDKSASSDSSVAYSLIQEPSGQRRRLTLAERDDKHTANEEGSIFRIDNLQSQSLGREKGIGAACWFPVQFKGKEWFPTSKSRWKTNEAGMMNLYRAERLEATDGGLYYVRYLEDFPAAPISNSWPDTVIAGFASDKRYVVETSTKVVQRCMLMTTDPGDLVLDPTCGSGTTAYIAEQWGRRWIAIDTSRVAVAIARQRLLTAKYDYYQLRDEKAGVAGNFRYKTVPHITLKSIAQNPNLDPIFAKHEPILDAKLSTCNAALVAVSQDVRSKLVVKLVQKDRQQGRRSVTDADRRRWDLPEKDKIWEHWTVPFDTDPEWPPDLQRAVTEYRRAWRAKMDAVNDCITNNAEQEELVDKPYSVPDIIRVSGPFTVEAVQPPEVSLSDVVGTLSPIGGEPDELDGMFEPARTVRYVEVRNDLEAKNVGAYLDEMKRLLQLDGVRFPNNKEMVFSRLIRIADGFGMHAEGRWIPKGDTDAEPDGDATVGVVFGPQYGPFTVKMLEHVIKPAGRRYDDLVIAAFNFTAEVQDLAANPEHPKLKIHVAHIRPDVNPGMAGLLKEQPGSQLFTVFGQPRTRLQSVGNEYVVHMEGVDIYDPVHNVIRSTEDSKVAAWFLDGDYDGRTFCITQAFFPDKSAWEKLSKAFGGVVTPERFEALSGTTSLPFPPGKHKCVAVKVIDPRGNEVMQVHRLEATS